MPANAAETVDTAYTTPIPLLPLKNPAAIAASISPDLQPVPPVSVIASDAPTHLLSLRLPSSINPKT